MPLLGPGSAEVWANRQRPELVEREHPVRELGGHVFDAGEFRLDLRVVGLFPGLGPLNSDLVLVQELPQPFAADVHPVQAAVVGQVVAEFAQAPPGERLVEGLGSGAGRRDDERFVVFTDSAGTATRPSRVQAGQPDLVEPVDHLTDRVLVTLHQAGARGTGVPVRRAHDDHRPAQPDR